MSDPLSNSAIQDVLSSIRRLVSEDRRARESQAPIDAVPGTPVVGKLILTEAHRVETVEEISVGIEEAPIALLAEGPAGDDDVAAVAEATLPVRPASVLEDDIASLESTIAELEAAVAGIGTDFEPDGSEVVGAANTQEVRALEDAFDDGFAVDTGDPVRVAPLDVVLDEPVAGRGFSPAVQATGESEGNGPAGEDAGAAPPRATDEIAFLRSPGIRRRADWQVISGGENGQMAGSGQPSRLHLRPTGDAESPADAGQHEAVASVDDMTILEAPVGIDGADVAASAPPEAGEDDTEALLPEVEGAAAAPDRDADMAAAWDMAADDAAFDAAVTAPDWHGDTVEEAAADATGDFADEAPDEIPETTESALAELAARESDDEVVADPGEVLESGLAGETLTEFTSGQADESAEEQAAVDIPEDLEMTLLSAAGLAGGAASALREEAEAEVESRDEAEAESHGETGDDSVDLFSNDDETVIDMEMLRELIVQVLREELQGPLGERITRNVRKLVRQEIARALESQKFE